MFLINVAVVMVQKMDLGDVFPFYLTQEEDEDDEDGWMDGWIDGWTDGWMDGRMNHPIDR